MGNAAAKAGEAPEDGSKRRKRRPSTSNKVATEAQVAQVPTCFTPGQAKQIREYFRRFQAAKAAEGDIFTIEDVDRVPELALNPFVGRVAEVVCGERANPELEEGEVDADAFLHIVSVFHPLTPQETKQIYAYKAFDQDGDGFVSRNDFIYVLSAIHPGLPLSELELKANLVFEAAQREDELHLTPDDFFDLFDAKGFAVYFTLPI